MGVFHFIATCKRKDYFWIEARCRMPLAKKTGKKLGLKSFKKNPN